MEPQAFDVTVLDTSATLGEIARLLDASDEVECVAWQDTRDGVTAWHVARPGRVRGLALGHLALGQAELRLASVIAELGFAPVVPIVITPPVTLPTDGLLVRDASGTLRYLTPRAHELAVGPDVEDDSPGRRPVSHPFPGPLPPGTATPPPDATGGPRSTADKAKPAWWRSDPSDDADADEVVRSWEPGDGDDPQATPDGTTREAHAHLAVPGTVEAEAATTIVVGLREDPQPNVPTPDPMEFEVTSHDDGDDTIDYQVQLIAPGWDVPRGRHSLQVPVDRLAAARIAIEATAPAVTEATATRVEVHYSQSGQVVGTAWREVVVHPSTESPPPSTRAGATRMLPGSTPAPDLTVTIVTEAAGEPPTWVFESPHDVALPDGGVPHSIPQGDATSFARQQVAQLSSADGLATGRNRILGVADLVAAAMPIAFWEVLAAVMDAAPRGDAPSILFVTADHNIPWELASTAVLRDLADPDLPPLLGAQFRVGRWPRPRPVPVLRHSLLASSTNDDPHQVPPVPPPAAHEVGHVAVVVGDYASNRNFKDLPHAEAEGDALVAAWPPASRLVGTAETFATLLAPDDAPTAADIVHIACHGTLDLTDHRYSGIVLSGEDNHRLQPIDVRGSRLVSDHGPLVFLNACQGAQDAGGLLDSGDFGATFTGDGAVGFVGPLWKVDDELASEIALDFYTAVLRDGQSAGEAMRACRARWEHGSGTRLAYVFWGHPDLTLTHSPSE